MVPRPLPQSCGSGRDGGCEPDAAFEALADDAMHEAGLVAPGSCRLVYDSAAGAADGTVAAWQQGRAAAAAAGAAADGGGTAQRGAHGFVLLGDGAVARRPAGRPAAAGSGDGGGWEPHGGGGGGGAAAAGAAAAETPVVSVMLPVERGEAEGGARVLTPLQHLYVVMVHPARRFQAFECGLSQPLYT